MSETTRNHKKLCVSYRNIIFLFLCFIIQPGISQEYSFRNFSSSDGLANPYIYSIVQDKQGFLWIGTGDGLSRFNGFVMQSFTTADSLAENFITSGIAEGNLLWFGHRNGRISFYNGKSFKKVSCNWEKSAPITHFARDDDGKIWVSTLSNGLFRLENDFIDTASRIFFNNPVYTFEFIDKDKMIIGTSSGLLYCIPGILPGTFNVRTVSEVGDTRISAIQKMMNGTGYLIATEFGGIFKLTNGSKTYTVEKIHDNGAGEFTSIKNIYEDHRGNIWLGSFGNGLIKIGSVEEGRNVITILNKTSGFITDNVQFVYGDREGNIWSGNYGDGLTQISPKLFSVHSFDKNRYGNNIFSICSGSQNRWVGTDKGLIKTDLTGSTVLGFYSTGYGLPQDTISSLYASDKNIVWIGTEKNGLFSLDLKSEQITGYTISDGMLENSVTDITGEGDELWIGTRKGLCKMNTVTKDMNWYSVSKGGLPHNHINSLYLDKEKRLWVSTNSNILSYIEDGKVNKLPLSTGSGILTLGPITEDSGSHIWVGSKGNGIFIIDSDSIFHLSAKEFLLSDYCYSLVSDENNYIWAGHKGGLSRIRTTDLTVKPVKFIDGVTVDHQLNANAALSDSNQNLWFGSDKGLICYNQSMELTDLEPPVLGITSVWVNDEKTEFDENRIVLSPGYYKIRIDFLGLSLKEPDLVTYQYRLKGFDEWSDITKNNSVTYNRLSDGQYSFIIKAASGDGVVTQSPVTFNIVIKKPIWKKWWFYVVSVTIIGCLIFIYIQRRIQRLLDEKRILEEKVRERTMEIQLQKNKIEKQKDLIEEKNKNITSSIYYASFIQNAILTPSEIINRLLPENFILSKPKDIVSGDFYWVKEKDNKTIMAVADCTGHGVPGAFMSMLGMTLLSEIVNSLGIIQPDEIISVLRDRVVQSLQQNRTEKTPLDGMDIALCVIDMEMNRIQYTGAMNDLVYVSDGKINVLKADRMGIGGSEFYGKFTTKELVFKKGDMIYLFSDGYKDQFGGELDKKFLRTHFYTILLGMSSSPVEIQKEFLEKKLYDWMKGRSQTDDITVIGVRL